VFAMRSKSRGSVDRTVCQLRFEGDWLRIVPGSFYADGAGGFACTAAYAPVDGRSELTGPLWAIEGFKRDGWAADAPAVDFRHTGLRSRQRSRKGDTRNRFHGWLSHKGTSAGPSF
jgi:hypothetical protein